MEAPKLVKNIKALDRMVAYHVRAKCKYVGQMETYKCKDCGTAICSVEGKLFIHYEGLCGDTQLTPAQVFNLPFCPKCEGKPTRTRTCIHT